MDIEDTGERESGCEWCGTALRYIYHLEHSEGITTTAGCVCTEHLCEDYTLPKEMLKKHKAELSKKSRAEKKREKAAAAWRASLEEIRVGIGWRQSEKGNYWVGLKDKGIATVFLTRNGQWKWVCNDVFSDVEYPTPLDAQWAFMEEMYPAL